jgi:hypothetical protein
MYSFLGEYEIPSGLELCLEELDALSWLPNLINQKIPKPVAGYLGLHAYGGQSHCLFLILLNN